MRTREFKYIRNFYPERPYSQHSGYKELQYPGMTVARVLKQRGQLTGSAATFWSDNRPREEFYDLQADPEETNNLIHDPRFESELAGLRADLDRWIKETNDQGRLAEADLKATVDSSNRWYEGRMQKRNLPPRPDPEAYLKWWERKLKLR